MIRMIFIFIVTLMGVFGHETLFVTYGTKPQSELILRYIDAKKEGFIKVNRGGAFETFKTETVQFGKKLKMHRLVITGLQPGQVIRFASLGSSGVYKAATLGKGDFSFCEAGDLYTYIKAFRKGIKAMASEDPDFVIFGGDLAYSTHGPIHVPSKMFAEKRYQTFLKVIHEHLVKADGSLIPVIALIGNHDYEKGSDELAYLLFFPEFAKTYFSYDLGEMMDLVVLDTGHMAPVSGIQTNFLKQTLKSSKKPYKLAAYHVGAYPSVYKYNASIAKTVRDNFCPQFDACHVQLAFEHHSHAFKVTHPLKNERIDKDGTIYLGDGCLGASPRKPKNKNAWYIEYAKGDRNYYKVEASQNQLRVYPKSTNSKLIHQVIEIMP